MADFACITRKESYFQSTTFQLNKNTNFFFLLLLIAFFSTKLNLAQVINKWSEQTVDQVSILTKLLISSVLYSPNYFGQETAIRSQSQAATCPAVYHTRCKLHCSPFYCWMSSRWTVNKAGFYTWRFGGPKLRWYDLYFYFGFHLYFAEKCDEQRFLCVCLKN